MQPPDLGDWGPSGHLLLEGRPLTAALRGQASALGVHTAPHRPSPAVLGARWWSSRRPLSGVEILVMTGVLTAVATLTLLVRPPHHCSDCGIQTGARDSISLLPSLGSDLSLPSGLQTSSALFGLVTLRVFSFSHFASFIPAYLATHLSLSPNGSQGPSRACPLLAQWSLMMRVHRPTPVTQAVAHLPPLLPCPLFPISGFETNCSLLPAFH